MEILAAMRTASSSAGIFFTSFLAASIFSVSSFRLSFSAATYASGSASNAILRLMTSILVSMLSSASTSTERPNLSRSWGLRLPSSGFMVPTSTNLAGWEKDTPSLST